MNIELNIDDLEDIYDCLKNLSDFPDLFGIATTYDKFYNYKTWSTPIIEIDDNDISNILYALDCSPVYYTELVEMFTQLEKRNVIINNSYLDSFIGHLADFKITISEEFDSQIKQLKESPQYILDTLLWTIAENKSEYIY